MLEELQTLLLVGLLVSTYYLTVGCRNIGETLPYESGTISEKVDSATDKIKGMTEVLDDIANLLNDGLHALTDNEVAQMPANPMQAILSGLITRMTSPVEHGSKTQPEEWEVLEADSKNPTQTETIIDGNSPVDTNR